MPFRLNALIRFSKDTFKVIRGSPPPSAPRTPAPKYENNPVVHISSIESKSICIYIIGEKWKTRKMAEKFPNLLEWGVRIGSKQRSILCACKMGVCACACLDACTCPLRPAGRRVHSHKPSNPACVSAVLSVERTARTHATTSNTFVLADITTGALFVARVFGCSRDWMLTRLDAHEVSSGAAEQPFGTNAYNACDT